MWKFISLTPSVFHDFHNTIQNFLININNLILLQQLGHFPLILAQQNDALFTVIIAPNTLETLSKIDSDFLRFDWGVAYTSIDFMIFETHDVLLGDRETFKSHILKNDRKEERCPLEG